MNHIIIISLFTISVGYYTMPQFKAVYNSPSGEREPYSHESVTDILLFIILNHFIILYT